MSKTDRRSAQKQYNEESLSSVDATPARSRKVAQILSAASELFLENGFDAVTMDTVSARAGVSKATLYVYFPSKEALFSAMLRAEAERINSAIVTPSEERWQTDDDIEVVLRNLASSVVEIFLSDRTMALQRALYGVLPRFAEYGQVVFRAGPAELVCKISNFLAEAHALGKLDVSDPELAARQFVSLARDHFDLAGILMLPKPDKATIERSIDASIALFLAGYGRK